MIILSKKKSFFDTLWEWTIESFWFSLIFLTVIVEGLLESLVNFIKEKFDWENQDKSSIIAALIWTAGWSTFSFITGALFLTHNFLWLKAFIIFFSLLLGFFFTFIIKGIKQKIFVFCLISILFYIVVIAIVGYLPQKP